MLTEKKRKKTEKKKRKNNFTMELTWDNKNVELRRRCIFEQTPKDWKTDKRLLYTAVALEKISNQLKNKDEKRAAKRDRDYYFNQLQELKGIGE